jgi:hypothetical protein
VQELGVAKGGEAVISALRSAITKSNGTGNAEVESLSRPWTSKNQWIVDTRPNGAAVMRDASMRVVSDYWGSIIKAVAREVHCA